MEIHVTLGIYKNTFLLPSVVVLFVGNPHWSGREKDRRDERYGYGGGTVFLRYVFWFCSFSMRFGAGVGVGCDMETTKPDKTFPSLYFPFSQRGFPDPKYLSLLFSRTLTIIPFLVSTKFAPDFPPMTHCHLWYPPMPALFLWSFPYPGQMENRHSEVRQSLTRGLFRP